MKIQRYLFIWLGLFLPTVGIGIIALSLLTREQTRLDALEQTTNRAQAQTIADNADLKPKLRLPLGQVEDMSERGADWHS